MTPDPRERPDARERNDRNLDEALEETFPASDPISPMHHRPDDPGAGPGAEED